MEILRSLPVSSASPYLHPRRISVLGDMESPVGIDHRTRRMRAGRGFRQAGALIGVVVSAVLFAACTSARSSVTAVTPSVALGPSAAMIPQPSLAKLNARTRQRLAPEARRVDLAVPTFSDPTNITNPLFPIGSLTSAVLIGKLHRQPWRAETTLLPNTKTVSWNGQQIETRQSQFVAYLNGRIFEVAVDLYAQADDGSVWYFGEDAFTYSHGHVADTEGTWLAGVTGPPAMIMPGHPHVGDVYRTENIPGLVFEQVTVEKTGVTVNGPVGPIPGAMVGQELHMDEVRLESKFFAPGYGEFFSGSGPTFEANALAVPVDALSQPTPVELDAISTRAVDILNAARSGGWSAASTALGTIDQAWNTFRAQPVPKRLAAQTDHAIQALSRAVGARDPRNTSQSAVDLMLADLDIELRYRGPAEVNVARFDAWTRQVQVDSTAGDGAAVVGDVTTLEWIRDRIALDAPHAGIVDDALRSLEAQAEAGELGAASAAAVRLSRTLAESSTPA
jgi:hypothetical protein